MHSMQQRPNRPPTLLVIDDETPILDLLGEALSEEGFHVAVAGDLPAALALLDREDFDLVLADSLASFDDVLGFEPWWALDAIRERAALTSVIIFSAHPARSFADLRERGFAGFVAKPFDLDLLAATLRGYLSPASDARPHVSAL